MVLVIPAVLALLGDNPMQSELACHVGLAGKFFCRCCWVKGRDAEDEHTGTGAGGDDSHSVRSDSSMRSDGSTPAVEKPKKKRQRRKETLEELVDRAKRFLGVSIQLIFMPAQAHLATP